MTSGEHFQHGKDIAGDVAAEITHIILFIRIVPRRTYLYAKLVFNGAYNLRNPGIFETYQTELLLD